MSILSGALQVLPFPIAGPVPVWRTAFCWIALVPLLWALTSKDKAGQPLRIRDAALLGYACGLVWYLGNCYWIFRTMHLYGGMAEPVALAILILFAMYLGLYHALFGALVGWMVTLTRGRGLALAMVPAIWVAVELARARVTGFPWDLLGNSQVDNLLLTRLAPYAGVMGLSLVIAAVNAGIAGASALRGKRAAIVAAFAVLLAAGLQLEGRFGAGNPSEANEAAVLLQENLEVGAMGRGGRMSPAQEIAIFQRDSLHPETAQMEGQPGIIWQPMDKPVRPNVIVWPEAPSNLQSNDPAFRGSIGAMAEASGAAVIAGSLGVDLVRSARRGYYLYDSASLFDAQGTYRGRYDKIHLVPWGEYVPFKQFFGFAQKLTEGVGDMDPGHERTVFRTGDHSYGVFVCYESIFGDEVRQFVKNGAEVLVNISDDGWYGDTGAPWQHLNMARMRAIENRRWVLRSTNTGVTTAIDPLGRVDLAAPRHVRGAYVFGFDFMQGQTFYTIHGDWLAYLCAVVTVLGVGFGWTWSRRDPARNSLD